MNNRHQFISNIIRNFNDNTDNMFFVPNNHNNNLKGGREDRVSKYLIKFKSKQVLRSGNKYIKINQNQLQILDALLNDGGYKKYIDSHNNLRYSEHSGLLDFTQSKLDRILVSGKTNREDNDDLDILLPQNMPDAFNYEYMFHTHPPTPYPGARAKGGILYEFPSISDLYHFTYHYNEGQVQGSMIIAPEGIYIIRMKKPIKHIEYPDQAIADRMELLNLKINKLAIDKYGSDFTNNKENDFYNKVAIDTTFVKYFNRMVQKLFHKDMVILYKPRLFDDATGKFIIKQLYVKVNPVTIKYDF